MLTIHNLMETQIDQHPRSNLPGVSENYVSYSQSTSLENRDDYDKEYGGDDFGKALNADRTTPLV